MNSVSLIRCAMFGMFLSLPFVLSGCGGSLTHRVYWPARTVFESRTFDAPDLNDRRWNNILILPYISAGKNKAVPSLQVTMLSLEKGRSLFLDHVILAESVAMDPVHFRFDVKKTIEISDPVHQSEWFIGLEWLRFDRTAPEGQFLGRNDYYVLVAFREKEESPELLEFGYPIVTYERKYFLPY